VKRLITVVCISLFNHQYIHTMKSSDIISLCINSLLFVAYITISMYLLHYYHCRRTEYYVKARGVKMLMHYGIVNTIVVSILIASVQWNVFPCEVIHIVGFLFPSLFMVPVIIRAIKVIAIYEDNRLVLKYIKFRYMFPIIVILNGSLGTIGSVTSRSLNDELVTYNDTCIIFHHWIYFVIVLVFFKTIMVSLYVRLRTVHDRFHVARELAGHFLVFTTFSVCYITVVVLVNFRVVTAMGIARVVAPQYCVVVVGVVGMYLSFVEPIRMGFYNSNISVGSNSVLNTTSTSPIMSHAYDYPSETSVNIGDLMRDPRMKEGLYIVSKRALCPELIHFLDDTIAYKDEALSLMEGSNPLSFRPERDLSPSTPPDIEKPLQCTPPRATLHTIELEGRERETVHNRSVSIIEFVSRIQSLSSAVSSTQREGIELDSLTENLHDSYLSIIHTYVESNSPQEVNLSFAARMDASSLMSRAAFAVATKSRRLDVFDSSISEIHSVVYSNLYLDLKAYLNSVDQ